MARGLLACGAMPRQPLRAAWSAVLVALTLALGGGACSSASDSADVADGDLDVGVEGLTGEIPVGTELVATGNVNLRSGPSTADSILGVVTTGTKVTLQTAAPSNGFYQIELEGTVGWSSGKYLEASSSNASSKPFAGGQVWKFHAQTLSMDVAIFVPEAASQSADVDVLVYAHGHNVCSPVAKKPPESFVTDAPFALGEVVAASQRPIVLVAPFFDWEHLAANGMAFGGKKHKLGLAKNLNGVVAEVLDQVGQHRGAAAPGLDHLYLAGHSRAYDWLNPLAAAHADPQMSTGALAKLTRIWAFDTTYACSPISNWSAWLASKPALRIDVFYRNGSGTAACGQAFEGIEGSSGGRLDVAKAGEDHCSVPAKRLPGVLSALP